MKDPNLLAPSLMPEFYRQSPKPLGGWRDYRDPRDLAQLQRDVTKAHDNLRKLVRVNDGLIRDNSKLDATVDNLWLALYGVIAAIGLTIAGLLLEVFLGR